MEEENTTDLFAKADAIGRTRSPEYPNQNSERRYQNFTSFESLVTIYLELPCTQGIYFRVR
jgi:hypothetical protein